MKKVLNNNCKILYTDTDSLIYEIRRQNIYHVMKDNIHRFDTSDYEAENQFGLPLVNKKIVGLMKDECNGKILTEFVGLRSKMYSIRVDGRDQMKKAKGIKSSVVKTTIDFEDYVACLRNNDCQYRSQYGFRSHLREIQTIKQTKLALSPFDDKRYLLDDTTDTLPWGHFKINRIDVDEDLMEYDEDC